MSTPTEAWLWKIATPAWIHCANRYCISEDMPLIRTPSESSSVSLTFRRAAAQQRVQGEVEGLDALHQLRLVLGHLVPSSHQQELLLEIWDKLWWMDPLWAGKNVTPIFENPPSPTSQSMAYGYNSSLLILPYKVQHNYT